MLLPVRRCSSGRNVAESVLERFSPAIFIGDETLYDAALAHPSQTQNKTLALQNQRQELLGDALLGLIVAELAFEEMPYATEGELTVARAALVNKMSVARFSRAIGLDRHAVNANDGVLADMFESFLAAQYLDTLGTCGRDGGVAFARTRELVRSILQSCDVSARNPGDETLSKKNFIGLLNVFCLKKHQQPPTYNLVGKEGTTHDPVFHFTVDFPSLSTPPIRASGKSQREAKQNAAKLALESLGVSEV